MKSLVFSVLVLSGLTVSASQSVLLDSSNLKSFDYSYEAPTATKLQASCPGWSYSKYGDDSVCYNNRYCTDTSKFKLQKYSVTTKDGAVYKFPVVCSELTEIAAQLRLISLNINAASTRCTLSTTCDPKGNCTSVYGNTIKKPQVLFTANDGSVVDWQLTDSDWSTCKAN